MPETTQIVLTETICLDGGDHDWKEVYYRSFWCACCGALGDFSADKTGELVSFQLPICHQPE